MPKIDFFGKEDMYLLKNTEYNKIPLTEEPFIDVLIDTEREFLILQLEDILTPKKIETTDSKIRNLSK